MKKTCATIIAATLAAGAMTSAAMAASVTIEFKRDSGETQVVTVDGAGTATLPDGTSLPYSYDADALTMCFTVSAEQENCATFAERVAEPKVGDSVRYTASDGSEGTATVTEIVE